MATDTLYQVPERKRKPGFTTSIGGDRKKLKVNDLDDNTKQYEMICTGIKHCSDFDYHYHHFIGTSMDKSLLTATYQSFDLNDLVQRLDQLLRHLVQENAMFHYSLIKKIKRTRKEISEDIDLLEGSARGHGSSRDHCSSVVDTLPTDIQTHIFSYICPGAFGKRSQKPFSTLHRFYPSNGTIRRIFKFMTGKSTLDFLREVDLMRYHNLKDDKEHKMLDYITPTRFTSPVIILTDPRNLSSVETTVASALNGLAI
jgi:hypothetical protein